MTITANDLSAILEAHRLWLRGEGGSRANLYGANLYGANLSRAYLSGADLYGANLSRANLTEADLSRANLSSADLTEANLYGADLSRANLTEADLSGAYLTEADLYGANLSGANLTGANLSGAYHIVAFGPVGAEKRIGYAVRHDKVAMVKLGCFWGTQKDALAAISAKYGPRSKYAALVRAVCACLMEG